MIPMISRRGFFIGGAAAALLPSTLARAAAPSPMSRAGQRDALLRRALAALDRHGDAITVRDRIGIADFSMPSRLPRFHIVNLEDGRMENLLVAHGKGSDPGHSGWLESFSNVPGSEASSAGAYVTGDLYTGKHGRSRRLVGLEPRNDNAEARAIVIHGAWYVSPDMAGKGKIGRSQGCFAVSEKDIEMLLDRLGPGRLIYADKLGPTGIQF